MNTPHNKRTYEQEQEIINEVCQLIEEGMSLRKAVKKIGINHSTFFKYIDNDENGESNMRKAQYARAMELRAEFMADEILDISDDSSNDTIYTEKGEIENKEWTNRSKLRVDSRKWLLSKLMPKKYGDKIDVTSDGEKVTTSANIVVNVVPPNDEE